MTEPIIRMRINFYGRVQGVGFRYYATHAADRVGATGWVRNEFTGSVSMEIQATRSQIAEVIAMIESDRYVRIDNIESREIPVIPDERRFRVR